MRITPTNRIREYFEEKAIDKSPELHRIPEDDFLALMAANAPLAPVDSRTRCPECEMYRADCRYWRCCCAAAVIAMGLVVWLTAGR